MSVRKKESVQDALKKQLHLCLSANERILWEGAPAKPRVFCKANSKLLLLAAAFLLVGVLWLRFRLREQVVSAAVVLIVLGLSFFGIVLRETWVLHHSRYAITDRRVILFTLGTMKILQYDQIPCVEMEYGEKDTCTIWLQTARVQYRSVNHWRSKSNYRAALVNIPHGESAAGLIRQKMREQQ